LAGNLLLAGYIGCGNHGDNAMMYGFTRAAENQGYSCVVLSGDPDAIHRDFNIRALDRKSGEQIDRGIAESDALVFPGGSIFQDVTSVRSVFYYANLIKKAKAAKKKVLLLGQGVGPLTTYLGKKAAAGAFQMADVVAVRDPGSVQSLQTLGVKGKIHVTADCGFLLMPGPKNDEEGGFAVGGMRVAGIAPRPLGRGRDVATLMGEFCRLLYQSGTMPVLIAMDQVEDVPLNNEISKRQGGRIPDIHRSTTPMQIQSRMSRMDCVVAMRLHAGILATTVDVPALMINYDPKVAAFARMLDIGSSMNLEGLTAQRMLDTFTAFTKDRDRNVKLVARKREELTRAAGKNIELLLETVNVSAKT
jgi:polysaccharide pyruvyl transferase CsaB